MDNSAFQLVERVKRTRDMLAFRDLVLAHQERIYRLIRGIVRSHEDTEDLLQETFIRALKQIGQLKDSDRFGAWLNRIALNLGLSHQRKNYARQVLSIESDCQAESPPDFLVDSAAGEKPLDMAVAREINSRLEQALRELSDNQRIAFVLFHCQGLSMREIAETMECPEVTVRTYVFRAVKNLRGQLKDYYAEFKG